MVYPFEDLRGGEYIYVYPTSYIPVVNLFHLGGYHRYPEQSGLLRANRSGRPVVSVGALDSAMPYLVATMMRQMRFTANVTPLETVNAKVDLREFDFVIRGKVKTTIFTTHMNIIPLTILGFLGMPYIFTGMELEYEVLMFSASDLVKPIMRKTYTYSDSTVVGLYYNHSAAFDMFIAGLETSLPDVVSDVAQAVKGMRNQASSDS